jgi:hypothetical protein
MLQGGTLGVRQERYGEAELRCVAPGEIDAKAMFSFLV